MASRKARNDQQSYEMLIEEKFKSLEQKLTTIKDEIIESLKKENKQLRSELVDTKSKLKSVERDIVNLQQYDRRNNVEIVGIPKEVSDKNLESKVLELFKFLKIEVSKDDIEACHRLRKKPGEKGPARSIVRFVNRKHAEVLLRCNKLLKKSDLTKIQLSSKNIYINCNLCPYNRMLWGKCKALYNKEAISRFWVFNGQLNIVVDDENERIRVCHIDDIKDVFGQDFPELFK